MKVIVENKHDDWRHLTVGDRIHHMKGRPYEGRRGLDDREIACRMNDAIDEGVGRICDELVRFRGSFAIIVETEREVICVTDPIRSIPIFYRSDGSKVSADANRLVSGTSHLDGRNTIEFMLAGFVTGDRTLYQDIRQMEYAEILAFPKDGGAPRGDRYFEYRYKASNESEERLMDDLGSAFEEAFERTAAELRRRHARAVVPLSGGLDSRIVLAMLRRMGVEDILCYTYGVRGNREARISRRVAREMDADWHFVRYTARKNYRAFNDPLYEEYRMFGSNLFSLAHSQEFLALKEMTEGGVLRDSDVIIPGHALDMLSGSHFPSFTLRGESDVEKGIDHIVGFHFSTFDSGAIDIGWLRQMMRDSIFDGAQLADSIETFDFRERQCKYIINQVRNYEFFDHDWLVPLWDRDIVDLFLKVPAELRHRQLLLKRFVRDRLFTAELSPLRDIPCTTDFLNGDESIFRKGARMAQSLMDNVRRDRNRLGRHVKIPISRRVDRPDAGSIRCISNDVDSLLGGPRPAVKEQGWLIIDYLSRLCEGHEAPVEAERKDGE